MDNDDSKHEDPFIAEGLSLSSSSDDTPLLRSHGNANQQRLQAAKIRREQLKRALFRAKDRRRQQQQGLDLEED